MGCGELRDENDVAFRVLAKRKKWKRCPKCRHFVELVDGCKAVRCKLVCCFLSSLFLFLKY
uniref:Uncharacterized protein LOC104224225 n=1 Tax=Nicotiana sylvestris TaxID=4096 RepID=A0A1U7WIQ8_NICSY|nr:PREDICTED: uncharacterized protein LOC104224225 [Nicotiana sylvestris]